MRDVMKCEQFIFEAAYMGEFGNEDLSRDAREHIYGCVSCRARFHRLRNEPRFHETESAASVGQRLHQRIEVAIAEAAQSARNTSWGRVGLQVALSLLILVGSIAGMAFQSHPTGTAAVYMRR